jgi:protocatechuate 3,4-dioxygenase beta subunit
LRAVDVLSDGRTIMQRRIFLGTISASVCLPLLRPLTAVGQDLEFQRALERAQRERPKTLAFSGRIAPASEPGDPLVIHGRAAGEDGKGPVAGAIVFAYHTDRDGLYDRAEAGPHSWRLKGWTRTAADGRFEFTSIRPGAYPGRAIPQHVHLNILLADGRRYWADELRFADDPLVPASERAAACRVRRQGSVQHVDFTLRLKPGSRF